MRDTRNPVKASSTYKRISAMAIIPSDTEYEGRMKENLKADVAIHRWKMDMQPYKYTVAEVNTDKGETYGEEYNSDFTS